MLNGKRGGFNAQPDDVAGGLESSPGSASGVKAGAANYADNVHLGARQGHGFAAEKMNHLYDTMSGKDAHLVGGDNAKNGADRMVDGSLIQTKFCQNARATVDACIADGQFRYPDMKIEVPKGQGAEVKALMKEKIRAGKISGLSAAKVDEIVIESKFSHDQAVNMARAGTIESLTYDAVNGLRLTGSAMGLSAALTFAVGIWNGKRWDEALDAACFEGLCVGGITWLGSVATAQLGRTGVESGLRSTTDWLSEKFSRKAASWLVNAGKGSASAVSDDVAQQQLSKLIRGNAVAAAVTTVVLSADDFILLFSGKASGTQIFKNVAKTASGVGGGTAGWLSGAAAGAAAGSAFPLVGTAIGGFLGGILGGAAAGKAASVAASKVLDHYIEDDAKEMMRCIERVFAGLAEDYLLTSAEADAVIKEFRSFDVPKLLQQMFARDHRENYAHDLLIPLMKERVAARALIALPSDEEVRSAARGLVERMADDQDGMPESPEGAQDEPVRVAPRAPTPPPTPKKTRPLSAFFEDYESHLTANSSVMLLSMDWSSKAKKKRDNAIQSYAHEYTDYKSEPPCSILLVDVTALGSAKDGIYITEYELFIKPMYESRTRIRVKDIKSLRLDESDREIVINGKPYSYTQSAVTPQMRIVVKCLEHYLEQFI
jgi:hypothetical protein